MSKAAELAALIANVNNGSSLANKNFIINGAMTVAQRGTSSTSSGMHTVDRTKLIYGGTDNAPTQAQVDVASGTTPYTLGLRKAFKVTNANQSSGAGAADYIQYEQAIEAQNVHQSGWDSTSTSSFITMSFWIKSSVARTFQGSLRVDDSTKIYNWNTGALSADTWTKVTKTISGASGVTINNDNGTGLQWILWPYIGTNYTGGGTSDAWKAHDSNDWAASSDNTTWYTTNNATCEITGLMIEVGEKATEFEHEPYEATLRKCQRYYYRSLDDAAYGMLGGSFMRGAYDKVKGAVEYAVEMRARPAVSCIGTNAGAWVAQQGDATISGTIGFSDAWAAGGDKQRIWITFEGATNGTEGYAVTMYRNNRSVGDGSACLQFDSEL